METKRTQATDIAEIATKLDGKVKFRQSFTANKCCPRNTGKQALTICILLAKSLGCGFIQAGRR